MVNTIIKEAGCYLNLTRRLTPEINSIYYARASGILFGIVAVIMMLPENFMLAVFRNVWYLLVLKCFETLLVVWAVFAFELCGTVLGSGCCCRDWVGFMTISFKTPLVKLLIH